MPHLKFKLSKISAVVLLISTGLVIASPFLIDDSYAHPQGGMVIDWGVTSGNPIFTVEDFKPCDVEKRTVKIKNENDEPKKFSVVGTNTQETGNIASIVDFVISTGGSDIYGGTTGAKTLTQFFADSQIPGGIPLATLTHDQSKTFTFTATFPCSAGNEYQEKKVVFDLKIGVLLRDLDCPDVDGTVKVYYPVGWHAIVGMSQNQYGADKVWNIGNNNFVQCYFPQTGHTGIQTDWMAAVGFAQSKINQFIADGWTLIKNGFDWGLPVKLYLAKNKPFTF